MAGKTEEAGDVCVPGRLFNEICQTLPDGQVTLVTDGNQLEFVTDKFQTKIHTLPVADFPTLPDPKAEVVVKMRAESARLILERVLFAASTSDTQVEISSVLFRVSDD